MPIKIEYHSTLNPGAWDDEGNLHPRVREKLLAIAEKFTNYLSIPTFEVDDIVLTGSMANYNWTEHSDFDLHIITDYSKLDCDDIAEEFYRAKKMLWNDRHNITINGHEVELYVEDSTNRAVSSGVYSVLEDRWLNQPEYDPPEIDDNAVSAKVRAVARHIRHCLNHTDDSDDLQRLMDKIQKMRKSGLATAGEFSTENIAFKVLRKKGLLGKLYKEYNNRHDHELSLTEAKMSPERLIAFAQSEQAVGAVVGFEAELIFPELEPHDPTEGDGHNPGYIPLSKDFTKNLGYPAYLGSFKPRSKGWAFESDFSIVPNPSPGGFGVEIISPKLDIEEAMDVIPRFFDWVRSRGGYVNTTCGFHINVSMPGLDTKKIDRIKLALFLGDKKVLSDFGRMANKFTPSFVRLAKSELSLESRFELIDSLKAIRHDMDEAAEMVTSTLSRTLPKKHISINVRDKYIEFRSAGGPDYLDNIGLIIETMARYVYAMSVAMNPLAERQEYAKKLFKFLSSIAEKNDGVKMFTLYSTGQVSLEKLKAVLAAKQKDKEMKAKLRK